MLAASHAARQLIRIHRNVHLIRAGWRVESHLNSPSTNSTLHRPLTSVSRMASLDTITQSLASLSIKPMASASHAAATSPAAWLEALTATKSAPESFELIKTLVYKPKTAKTAVPVPVVVIARDGTETNSGTIGKKLNLKELRLASGDLLTEFFGLDKDSRAFFGPLRSIVYSLELQFLLSHLIKIPSQKF